MGFKDLKTKYLVDVATKLFLKRGINDVTIKDIASEAEIGEATIYRHFAKKQNIVLASALTLKEKVFKGYFDLSKGKTGFEKVEIFYSSYLSISIFNIYLLVFICPSSDFNAGSLFTNSTNKERISFWVELDISI